MKRNRLLAHVVVFSALFAFGFVASLGLHWSIRPTQADTGHLASSADISQMNLEDFDFATLAATNVQLKASVASLETTLAKVETQQAIDEGHARALILELQTYREDRDRLFADLEQRKQQLKNKVEQLDEKIQAQLALREAQPVRTDYELANELLSLLSYPHALNDIAALNSELLATPAAHEELVQLRFELMLQPEDYPKTDAVYEALQPAIAQLNKQHGNDTRLIAVFCSQRFCEIQTQMQQQQPYFDYWQQWLKTLQSIDLTKRIQQQFATTENGTVIGTALISL